MNPVRGLLEDVSRRYGVELELDVQLHGGEESSVWQVQGSNASYVLRVSPAWRTVAELEWAYALASFAAAEIPEVLAPLRAADGSLAFAHDGRVVSVFPFVEGAPLDRRNDAERDAAARLLADLHRVLPRWPNARARPASGPSAPRLVPSVDPPGLDDAELDAAVARYASLAKPALAHGDYYRGNLRCVDHRIVALFDWDDACYWTHENELAWSVWEFAQADDSATLDLDRARRFLGVYAEHGGPVTLGDTGFIIPFIRDDIRTEIREAAATLEAGGHIDKQYVERSNDAFENLKKYTISDC